MIRKMKSPRAICLNPNLPEYKIKRDREGFKAGERQEFLFQSGKVIQACITAQWAVENANEIISRNSKIQSFRVLSHSCVVNAFGKIMASVEVHVVPEQPQHNPLVAWDPGHPGKSGQKPQDKLSTESPGAQHQI